MKSFGRPFEPIKLVDTQNYICDLVNIEGPLVCLFRDTKKNWVYIWCDTDGVKRERWVIFPVSRPFLIAYLKRSSSLLDLVVGAESTYVLDIKSVPGDRSSDNSPSAANDGSLSTSRRLKKVALSEIEEYLPSSDSLFEEGFAPDISLARELVPVSFDIPIDGNWFFADLNKFSKIYSQLYAFFYCTKPRFVKNIGERVRSNLSAPWMGGYSRVNLFEALKKSVPSLHDLEIKSIQYASPGQIKIEALNSVGESVAGVVKNYLENRQVMVDAEKSINTLLSSNHLRRLDLSAKSDDQLFLSSENLSFLIEKRKLIASRLGCIEEFNKLAEYSPNSVVSAKAQLALLVRVKRLAELQASGLTDL